VSSRISTETLEQVVAFHGHLCPGLTTGIRVAEIALRELGPRARDEEIVAVAETNNCAVDAIQYLVGCTVGKGNLVILEHGKQVFTFGRRSDSKAIRVAAKARPSESQDTEGNALSQATERGQGPQMARSDLGALWRKRALAVLVAEEDELFDTQILREFAFPERASIARSIRCDACGEMTMACRMLHLDGRSLCLPCAEAALASRITMQPIGMVHNKLKSGRSKACAHSPQSTISVYPEYAKGLRAIESCERLEILFCFDRARTESVPLRQHPMGDRNLPARGVFTLRSPRRPNPIGLTTVTLTRVEGNTLTVSGLDAWDGTPVLDIKPSIGG